MCTSSYASDKCNLRSGLNLGLPRTNQGSGEGSILNLVPPDYYILFQRFNCLATLTQLIHMNLNINLFCLWLLELFMVLRG